MNMTTDILSTVRAMIGRRHRITRGEMRGILCALAEEGKIDIVNPWFRPRDGAGRPMNHADVEAYDPYARRIAYANGIERACADITVISVLSYSDSRPGDVRYDQPGSMHPLMMATVMFAPAAACERIETLNYLRRHAKRLLIVEGEAAGA